MGENEGTPPEEVTDYRLPRLFWGRKTRMQELSQRYLGC